MISTIKKTALTPLEAQYRDLIKLSSASGNPPGKSAGRKSANQEITTVDIVTLSSQQPRNEDPAVKLKAPQPVTPAERSALLDGFSVYG